MGREVRTWWAGLDSLPSFFYTAGCNLKMFLRKFIFKSFPGSSTCLPHPTRFLLELIQYIHSSLLSDSITSIIALSYDSVWIGTKGGFYKVPPSNEKLALKIYDVTGKFYFEKQFINHSSSSITFVIPDLSKGTYLVQLLQSDKIETLKVVKAN